MNILLSAHRASPAIPHWPVLSRLIRRDYGHRLKLDMTPGRLSGAMDRRTYYVELPSREEMKGVARKYRDLLKAAGVKAPLSKLAVWAQDTFHELATMSITRQRLRHVEPLPSLEERVVAFHYESLMDRIRYAVISNDTNTTIVIKRGEHPDVKDEIRTGGYGWGEWRKQTLTITLEKGWAIKARERDPFVSASQMMNLVVERQPADDLLNEEEQQMGLCVEHIAYIHRCGNTREIRRAYRVYHPHGLEKWTGAPDRVPILGKTLVTNVAKRAARRMRGF